MKDNASEPKGKKDLKKRILSNPFLYLSLLIAIAWGVSWMKSETTIEEVKHTAMEKNKEMVSKTKSLIRENDSSNVKLIMKPLVWSIRGEMLRDNLEQVGQYLNHMVKEKNFELLMIVSPDGSVLLSTDKKTEGKDFDIYPEKLLNKNEVIPFYQESINLHISAPIMGYNNRLGTLYARYSVEQIDLK